MDEQRCIRAFRDLARRLDIDVRMTAEGPSGLCTMRGRTMFFLDRTMPPEAQIRLFVREFKTLDLTGYFVVPVIRDLLEKESEDGIWDLD